jgi:putative sterol carrier protein
MPREFLSDEWIETIDSMRGDAPEPAAVVKDIVINIVVTDTPYGDRESHMKGGHLEQGLADDATTTMTMPYEVAKQLFITQDQQAVMQAFVSGQIKATGDMTQLMKMQSAPPPTPEQEAVQARIRDLTI